MYLESDEYDPIRKIARIEYANFWPDLGPREWTRVSLEWQEDSTVDVYLWWKDDFNEMMLQTSEYFTASSVHFLPQMRSEKDYLKVAWFLQQVESDEFSTDFGLRPLEIELESEVFKLVRPEKKRNYVFSSGIPKPMPPVNVELKQLPHRAPALCGRGVTINGIFYEFDPTVIAEAPRAFQVNVSGTGKHAWVFKYTLCGDRLVMCTGNAYECVIYAVLWMDRFPSEPFGPIIGLAGMYD